MGRGKFKNRFVSDSIETSAEGKFFNIYFSPNTLKKISSVSSFMNLKFPIHKLRIIKCMCRRDVVKTK